MEDTNAFPGPGFLMKEIPMISIPGSDQKLDCRQIIYDNFNPGDYDIDMCYGCLIVLRGGGHYTFYCEKCEHYYCSKCFFNDGDQYNTTRQVDGCCAHCSQYK